MKDLFILIGTTLVIAFVWTTIETGQVVHQSFAPKDLLEISSPINGTIDTEYLGSL